MGAAEEDTLAAAPRPPRPDPSAYALGDTVPLARGSGDPGREDPREPARRRAPLRIEIADGRVVPVDRTLVVGRDPAAPRVLEPTGALLVRVPSPRGEVSASHVELRPAPGAVELRDLRSRNGTAVLRPGRGRERLGSGAAVVLAAGSIVDLGDGAVLRVLAPENPGDVSPGP